MSLTYRNLALLALFCGIVSSMSISHAAYKTRNAHQVKVQEFTSHSHQLAATDPSSFASKIQSNVDAISSSIKPAVPSIIETKNLPAFAFSRSTCESLSDDQKKQILDKVTKTKDSIKSFKTNVKDEKVLANADNSFRYLSVVEQLVNKNCGDISTYLLIGPSPYQTNLITDKSWILGGITNDDLVKDYTDRITNNNNVTNCGSSTPFWNGLRCITCSDPTPVFNIATAKCEACPTGTDYDAKTHTCIKSGVKNYKPNPTAESKILVPATAPKDALSTYMNTGTQVCPVEKPFVKNNTCIACPTEKPYFNLVTKECVAGTPNATDVPVYNPRLVMNDNSTMDDWNKYVKENENKFYCKEDTPFWTGTTCIQCPQLFNVITRKCVNCDSGLALHTDTHKCEPAEPLEPSLKDLFNAIF